jgi:hypothetical protein
VSRKAQDSPICPGSVTFPDIVSHPIRDELTYVCATCRASVPKFEAAPVHRNAVPTVRVDPAVAENQTTELDELCVIEK